MIDWTRLRIVMTNSLPRLPDSMILAEDSIPEIISDVRKDSLS